MSLEQKLAINTVGFQYTMNFSLVGLFCLFDHQKEIRQESPTESSADCWQLSCCWVYQKDVNTHTSVLQRSWRGQGPAQVGDDRVSVPSRRGQGARLGERCLSSQEPETGGGCHGESRRPGSSASLKPQQKPWRHTRLFLGEAQEEPECSVKHSSCSSGQYCRATFKRKLN